MVNYTVQLDLTDNGIFDCGWRIKQGDYGNSKLIISVVDNGVNAFDSSVTPQISFRTPDGKSIVANMTVGAGVYSYVFAGNELAVAGKIVMDVKITNTSGRMSTASCFFTCVEDTIQGTSSGAGVYDNDISKIREEATGLLESSIDYSLNSEGYAVGTQNGEEVGEDSPYYHNNAKYYAEHSGGGGGGGTSNYNDLSNKPSINNVTLSGNKTLSQLGIPTSYAGLNDKPSINSVVLSGNKSLADLGINNGDMSKSSYDADSTVANAGGIASYVTSAINSAIVSAIEGSY